MASPIAVTSLATWFCSFGVCLLGSACEGLLGSVDVIEARPNTAVLAPEDAASGPTAEPAATPPVTGSTEPEVPGAAPSPGSKPLPEPGSSASSDAGVGAGSPNGGDSSGGDSNSAVPPPSPPSARPIVVADGPSALPRIGVDGGEPHRGVCVGGIVVGVRPTANPSEDIYGQRLTSIEPICGTPTLESASTLDGPASARISVVADATRLVWDETGDFQGAPSTEVPDPRLVWVPQPATLCPEAAPVLVGLSGEYDSAAPDSTVTAAIRSLLIECAPLVVADNGVDVAASEAGHQIIARADSFAADGSEPFATACPEGSVTTEIQIHAGFWLDGFLLGCSSLRSPQPAGAACSAGGDCQSGVCGPESTCSS